MTLDEPVTASDVLWDRDRAAAGLARALYQGRVSSTVLAGLGPLAVQTYSVLDERIVEALRAPLAVELGPLVVQAWRGYGELLAVAYRTLDAPGRPEDVVLAEHEISSEHRPAAEVRVDGATYTTLVFDLTITLRLRSVVAVVDRGAIVGLRGGDVVAAVRLGLREAEVARGQRRYDVEELVRPNGGLSLVPAVPWPRGAARLPEQTRREQEPARPSAGPAS